MSAALAWALLLGLSLGSGLWIAISATPALSRPRLARRVAPYLVDVSAGARQSLEPAPPGPLPVFSVVLEPVLSRLRRLLAGVLGGSELTVRRLRQSGSTMTVEAFRSQQVLFAIGGALVGVIAAISLGGEHPSALLADAALVVLCAGGGVVVRDQLLRRSARRRLRRLSEELPVVLEFLTLSLSAGEGILDAVRRVSRVGTGELSRELAGVVSAAATGLPFADTLVRLARDLDLPGFTRIVDQVVGALDRGSPLAEVLRAQAQDARDETRRELLEVAGRKEVAMLVPLVFLILPVTIVFAVFPGIMVLQVGF